MCLSTTAARHRRPRAPVAGLAHPAGKVRFRRWVLNADAKSPGYFTCNEQPPGSRRCPQRSQGTEALQAMQRVLTPKNRVRFLVVPLDPRTRPSTSTWHLKSVVGCRKRAHRACQVSGHAEGSAQRCATGLENQAGYTPEGSTPLPSSRRYPVSRIRYPDTHGGLAEQVMRRIPNPRLGDALGGLAER